MSALINLKTFLSEYSIRQIFVISGFVSVLTCLFLEEPFFAVGESLLIYITSFYLLYLSTRTLKLITPAYLYFFFYTIYCYIWALSIFIKEEAYDIGEISIYGHGYDLLFATTLGIFCFSIGVLITTAVLRFNPYKELSIFRQKKWIDDMKGVPFAISITLLILLGLTLAIIFFSTRGIPILTYSSVLQASDFFAEMAEARIKAQWGAGYFMQGITLILPFCTFVLYAKGLVNGQRIWKLWAFLIATLTIMMMITLTSRGHFFIFLALLFLLHQLLVKQINWRKAVIFFLISVVLFLGVSIFKTGYFLTLGTAKDFLLNTIEIFSYRLSMGTKQFHAMLQIFPEPNPFILGRSYIWDIVCFIPGPDIGFNSWVFSLVYPFGLEGSTVTPLSLGEFYANFGWPGIIIGSAILGAFLQMLYIKFIRSKGKLSHLVVFVIFSTYLAKSSMNGLGAILEPIVSMAASYFLILWMSHVFRKVIFKQADQ